jgi:hypothetical protein
LCKVVTGTTTKNLILSTPTSATPVATPDGTSIIVINKGTSTGTLVVYTTSTSAGTNVITTLNISANSATTGGQFVYSATTGWVALFGNS